MVNEKIPGAGGGEPSKRFDPSRLSKQSILEDFWHHVQFVMDHFGELPFLITRNGSLTFAQVNNLANCLATDLSTRGFFARKAGVGLFIKDPLKIIPAMLAVMKTGNYFVPLDVNAPRVQLELIASKANLKLVLADDLHADRAKALFPDPNAVITIAQVQTSGHQPFENFDYKPDDLVQILFTSGSTGQPKGAIEDYRYLARGIRVKLMTGEYAPHKLSLQLSSFTYSAPHTHTFSALLSGTTLYYLNLEEQGFSEVKRVINQYKVTNYNSTGTIFRSFMDTLEKDEVFPSVQYVRLGGEKRYYSDIVAVKRHFPNAPHFNLGFASTETQIATSTTLHLADIQPDAPISDGYPVEGATIQIMDENGKPLPDGEAGEIYVTSDDMARGYINDPQLTAQHFFPDSQDPSRLTYKTGDLGKIMPDGQLFHMGRLDNMVKIKGVRIELDNIEYHLRKFPGISQVVSKVLENEKGQKKIACYYLTEGNSEIPASDLRRYLLEILPTHQVPHYLVKLDKFPLTVSGKIARHELPLPKMSRPELDTPFFPPADELEHTLLQIWEEQLGMSGIGVMDGFFDLGGDSLAAVALVSAIEVALDQELPVSALLTAPTIRQQAHLLRNNLTGDVFSNIIPIRPEGKYPPLFFIPGKGGYPIRVHHLAKKIHPQVPVYALQDLMHDMDFEAAHRSVESIARIYLNAINSITRSGRLILVGESMGGKICYEIAQLLHRQAKEQPLVFMLDTYNFDFSVIDKFKARHHIDYFWMLFKKHTSILLKANWQGKLDYLRFYKDNLAKKIKDFRNRSKAKPASPELTTILEAKYRPLELKNLAADRAYEIQPYPGTVYLVKALKGPYAYDPTNGWDKIEIGNLQIHPLDCYHGSILFEPAVSELAKIIDNKLLELGYRQ